MARPAADIAARFPAQSSTAQPRLVVPLGRGFR